MWAGLHRFNDMDPLEQVHIYSTVEMNEVLLLWKIMTTQHVYAYSLLYETECVFS